MAQRVTAENFETYLLQCRDDAVLILGDLALEEVETGRRSAVADQFRGVQHATEVALGMLYVEPSKYRPPRQAVEE